MMQRQRHRHYAPLVNPWAPILSAIRISSVHSQRHIHSRSRVEAAVGAVACNQRLPCRRWGNPAAEKLCIIKYCIYTYTMALVVLSRISLIISFDFDFVQFIQLWIGIPGPPTLAAPLVGLLALSWAHCRWLCLAAVRFDLLYQAKATKRCGISNNNWENTKIQKEISVWGLQRVFGWQT